MPNINPRPAALRGLSMRQSVAPKRKPQLSVGKKYSEPSALAVADTASPLTGIVPTFSRPSPISRCSRTVSAPPQVSSAGAKRRGGLAAWAVVGLVPYSSPLGERLRRSFPRCAADQQHTEQQLGTKRDVLFTQKRSSDRRWEPLRSSSVPISKYATVKRALTASRGSRTPAPLIETF